MTFLFITYFYLFYFSFFLFLSILFFIIIFSFLTKDMLDVQNYKISWMIKKSLISVKKISQFNK